MSDSPVSIREESVSTQDGSAETLELPDFCARLDESIPETRQGVTRLRELTGKLEDITESQEQAVLTRMKRVAAGAAEEEASDLEIGGPACQGKVWYRVDGVKEPRPRFGKYQTGAMDVFLLSLLNRPQRERITEDFALDFSFSTKLPGQDRAQRFRGALYMEHGHLALNMRLIRNELRPLESLGFHPGIQRGMLFDYVRSGLTLVTGVTGSGKSTTLDAIIDANNKRTPGHIVVIGEPIEYVHSSDKCIVRHREVGKEVGSFKEGVVQALRQDPDIVVIGEMRDPETISSAMEVADTGHRVFSTLHTSSSVESLDRIVAEYPPWEQERVRTRLADTLTCIISQKLCPKIGGGRILAKEVLWVTSSVKAAIKNNNTDEIYQMIWEDQEGMTTLEQDLYKLVQSRKITKETARSYANNSRRLNQLLA